MTLSARLRSELSATVGQTGRTVRLVDGRRTLRCEVERCDPLAVTAVELLLETPELASASLFQLQAASAALAQRVNYLLEPIAPIETDAQGCHVQMRSNPPQRDDNGRRYYELLLRRGGAIELCRYEKQPGQPRTRVPAVLTHEVVCRLVADFVATVESI
ncbi:MAG: hypothetical protein KF688_06415 [Pirellulales bacterium]|nr:hypothetical protein [Pirellulales bacterium]